MIFITEGIKIEENYDDEELINKITNLFKNLNSNIKKNSVFTFRIANKGEN